MEYGVVVKVKRDGRAGHTAELNTAYSPCFFKMVKACVERKSRTVGEVGRG